jgi:hypothetical protein
MNDPSKQRSFRLTRSLLIAFVTLALPTLLCAPEAAGQFALRPGKETPDGKEIFGTREAADLVAEARKHDPMYCPRQQADRDKAVLLYEQAMAAQPGAKINAVLADRVAQLYAFYEDKDTKTRPIRSKANQWWNRCLESTKPSQLLWAQAQMGLASMAVIAGDHRSALSRYSKILEMNVSVAELPDWQAWPDGSSEEAKTMLKRERARLRKSIERVQAHAAEKQFYVLCRINRIAALAALENIAVSHKGTQAGDYASNMIAQIGKTVRTDPWTLPKLTAVGAAEHNEQVTARQPDEPQKTHATRLAPPALAESHGSYWNLPVAVLATIGAAILAAGLLWAWRRKRP